LGLNPDTEYKLWAIAWDENGYELSRGPASCFRTGDDGATTAAAAAAGVASAAAEEAAAAEAEAAVSPKPPPAAAAAAAAAVGVAMDTAAEWKREAFGKEAAAEEQQQEQEAEGAGRGKRGSLHSGTHGGGPGDYHKP
jgi:hypothetical protein